MQWAAPANKRVLQCAALTALFANSPELSQFTPFICLDYRTADPGGQTV